MISEIEFNPVLVHPEGQGVTVVDALACAEEITCSPDGANGWREALPRWRNPGPPGVKDVAKVREAAKAKGCKIGDDNFDLCGVNLQTGRLSLSQSIHIGGGHESAGLRGTASRSVR